MSLPKSPSRQEDQSTEVATCVSCPWPHAVQPLLGHPRVLGLTTPQDAPFQLYTTLITQEFFLGNSGTYSHVADMPQSYFCPRSPPRTSGRPLNVRGPVSDILSQGFSWPIKGL